MKPFDLPTCPLEGVNLIEASAGTGKTYALAGLFLRFLLEKKYAAKQILVITFTNAATAELKSRIRRMIIEARRAFISQETSNPFIRRLLDQFPEAPVRKNIVQQLNDVLANYDETAIFTIHGFCQRALADNAFASGLPFDMEFIADQKKLEREFAEDFWRRRFYDNHPFVVRYALARGLSVETFQNLLQLSLTRPDLKIIPEDTLRDGNPPEKEIDDLQRKYRFFKDRWRQEKEFVKELLQDKALNGQVYGKKAQSIVRDVDNVLKQDDLSLPVPACMKKISAEELLRKTNKNQITPSHDLFDLCQALCDQADHIAALIEDDLTQMKKDFLKSAKVDFPDLKKRKNILYFDDLLNRTYEAVQSRDSGELARTLRRQYSAVLVDEFQDTDPVQYAILHSVFAGEEGRGHHAMFYIGDPKQAIYSFRGADIHAYLRAEKNVDERYTMTSNWRSEQTLITAINTMFGKPSRPFVYDEIGYTPVNRPAEQKTKPLNIRGDNPAGLYWWYVPGGDDGKPMGISHARAFIMKTVIREISRLIGAGAGGTAFIGEDPLSAGDIAVLVKKNSEAVAFKNALSTAGIPSVVYSSKNVFSSSQADDLRLLMLGIIHYEHEGRLLAALCTPFFAYSANDLCACQEDGDRLEPVRAMFKKLNDIWRKNGFLTMFLGLLEEEGVRLRIASQPEGERRLTNYTHLAQLLYQAQKEGHLQPSDLLIKLEEMMKTDDGALEDEQQKLETDRDGVRIVTIHRCKGLEYPVVFCPYAWENITRRDKNAPVFFHDEDQNWQAIADLGSKNPDISLLKARREELAEDCRLLYVALTRAKNRCYLISGNIRDTRSGSVSYLFHRRLFENQNAPPEDSEMLEDMRSLGDESLADISIKCLDGETGVPTRLNSEKESIPFFYREFAGRIHQGWKIASYTYLVKSIQEEKEWDEAIEPASFSKSEGISKPEENISGFPLGATSGILLHEILEKLNFRRIDDEKTKAIIKETLNRYNYSQAWQQPIMDMLRSLVNAKLMKPEGGEFSLSEIEPSSCIKEMEFYFPLEEVSSKQITEYLEEHERILGIKSGFRERRIINVPRIRGFLRGFIDLIFQHDGRYYLADWKSNHLGDRCEFYEPENLKKEILGVMYDLQYMIYTVALNLYLKRRFPDYTYENHFGGVYYFFLRGMKTMDGSTRGVYFDRPDQTFVERMEKMMLNTASRQSR